MRSWIELLGLLSAIGDERDRKTLRKGASAPRVSGWSRWLGQPRNGVFIVLTSALVLGGGRRLLQAWRARGAVARLDGPDVTVDAIADAAKHGRAGLMDLFRLLGTGETESIREAAGAAIASLWAQDELVAEEEKALVRRGYVVTWNARRRYPRALRSSIPIGVSYGVPFLRENADGVAPSRLEWSHRIQGARRAALESFSDWKPGSGRVEFSLVPEDFTGNGPHKLVLQSRVRTVGLTDAWEIELPQIPFSFEFDPRLSTDALFAMADDSRAVTFARAVRLERAGDDGDTPRFLNLSDEMALRAPPDLVVAAPIPCDLAHRLSLEFEGVEGRISSTDVIVSGQGGSQPDLDRREVRFTLNAHSRLSADALSRPAMVRIRAVLTADPELGWGNPDVRSIWPGTLETEWIDAEVVRR